MFICSLISFNFQIFQSGFASPRVRPLLSTVYKNVKSHYLPLRTSTSEKLNKIKAQDGEKPKKNDPLAGLPPLISTDDQDFTKYMIRGITHPSIVLMGARNFAEECRKLYKEKRDELAEEFIIRDPINHIDMLYTFEKQEDVDKFLVTSDMTNNTGNSTGTLTLTQEKTALFSGYLNLEAIKTGNTKVAGFATMMGPRKRAGFRMRGYFDWKKYTHIVLKVRGDGRSYLVLLTTPERLKEVEGFTYASVLYTRGGPYWQVAKLPFNHFFYLKKGRLTDDQDTMINLDQIGNFGITAAGFDGDFKLEIDYVGLEQDPFHNRTSAYEEYK